MLIFQYLIAESITLMQTAKKMAVFSKPSSSCGCTIKKHHHIKAFTLVSAYIKERIMKTTFRLSALTLASLLALNACQDKPAEQAAAPQAASAASAASAAAQASAPKYDNSSASAEDKDLLTKAQGVFQPLPARAEIDAAQPLTEDQIQLGQQL